MTNHELSKEHNIEFLKWSLDARTADEALAGYGNRWIIEGWLAASATGITGHPKVGKSTLAADLAAAVINREDWHGVPVESDRTGPVIVVVTDPGDSGEWSLKAKERGVDWLTVQFHPNRWDEVVELATESEAQLLIFDNVTGALDEAINDADPSKITGPLTRITVGGTPVVLIAHSAKGGGSNPMGPTAYHAWQSHGLHITGSGNAQRKVKREGNQGAFPKVALGEAGESPSESTPGGSTAQRSASTLDRNAAMAQHVVEECQGLSANAAGSRLAAEFGLSEGTCQGMMKGNGTVIRLLDRDDSSGSVRWSMKSS